MSHTNVNIEVMNAYMHLKLAIASSVLLLFIQFSLIEYDVGLFLRVEAHFISKNFQYKSLFLDNKLFFIRH